MCRVEAECPFCGEKSGSDMVSPIPGMAPMFGVVDSEVLGCEHAVRFNNGTVFFSTVTFVCGEKWETVPCEPEK